MYRYEGIEHILTHYPDTYISYCTDCKKIVCAQRGINNKKLLEEIKCVSPDRAKYYMPLITMLNGRNTKSSCIECGGSNIVEIDKCSCPKCKKGILQRFQERTGEDIGVRIRIVPKSIKPVFEDDITERNVKIENIEEDNKINQINDKRIKIEKESHFVIAIPKRKLRTFMKTLLIITFLFIAFLIAYNFRYERFKDKHQYMRYDKWTERYEKYDIPTKQWMPI